MRWGVDHIQFVFYLIMTKAKDMFLQAIDFAKDGLDIVCEQMVCKKIHLEFRN